MKKAKENGSESELMPRPADEPEWKPKLYDPVKRAAAASAPKPNPEWVEKPHGKTTIHARVAYHPVSATMRVVWSNEDRGLPLVAKNHPARVAWEVRCPIQVFYGFPTTDRAETYFYYRVYGHFQTRRITYEEFAEGLAVSNAEAFLKHWEKTDADD